MSRERGIPVARRFRCAAAWSLGLAWSLGSSVLASAGPRTASVAFIAPPRDSAKVVTDDSSPSPGSPANPIPLSGTETVAPSVWGMRLADHDELRMGSITTALEVGRRMAVPVDAGAAACACLPESDVYAGGELGVELGHATELRIDAGRVTLRDPISVLGRDGTRTESWTAVTAFAIRF